MQSLSFDKNEINSSDILIECYVLHMYACENVEIRTCLPEGIDHIVRYI
jgi:hypothetical protein